VSAHTPGPWFVVADPQWAGKHPNHASRFICNVQEFASVYPPTEGEDDGWQVFHDENGRTICHMTDTVEIEANARLIAAAPELLEALECALGAVEYFHEHEGAESIVEIVNAAISKAKGISK